MGVGPDPDTIALYERILEIEGEEPASPAQRAAVLIATGLVHLNRGAFVEAERLARQAREMAIDAGLGHELGDAATLLALVSFSTGRWNEVFREDFKASVAHKPDLAKATYDANACFAEYYVSGTDGPAGAAIYARELLNLAVEAGSVPGRGLAQLMLGEALLFSGVFDGARDELLRALELGTGAGFDCLHSVALERLQEAHPAAARSELRSHLLVRLLGIGVQVPSEPRAAHGRRQSGRHAPGSAWRRGSRHWPPRSFARRPMASPTPSARSTRHDAVPPQTCGRAARNSPSKANISPMCPAMWTSTE